MEKYTLNIDTHSVEMPVVRDGAQVGCIKICPDDTEFLGKFYALLPKLETKREMLASALTNSDTEKTLDAMHKLWTSLRNDIDDVFGQGTSDTTFGDVCSLTMVQQFFDGVGTALQASRADKIEAYTNPEKAVLK